MTDSKGSPEQLCIINNNAESEGPSDDSETLTVIARQLLEWLNDLLETNYKRIEELRTGAAYAQLMDLAFPGTVPLKQVKFCTDLECEYIQNFKIVQGALKKVGCDKEIPVKRLVKAYSLDSLKFLHWFKKFLDANYDGHEYNALQARDNISLKNNDNDSDTNKQIVLVGARNKNLIEDDDDEEKYIFDTSLMNYSWSRKILELIGNKAKLMESFSWLSTIGGGLSALGERDSRFSLRAGNLSLGQQLYLAELLGDERLKVMCHIFTALAALQMNNRRFCANYIVRVISPMIRNLPYRDPTLSNMLTHLFFRLRPTFVNNAIEQKQKQAK